MNQTTEKSADLTTAPEAKHLPEPVRRRNLSEAEWRTLKNSLFPGASNDSVLMVVDYCRARKLDPLKKPCHIVPMRVKNMDGNYEYRDVVMPGIYELRTTAQRTGHYLGHSKPVYGPEMEIFGVEAPEWCELTVYRYHARTQAKVEFPVRVYFREAAATKNNSGQPVCNERWSRAPIQMLTKCAEAAALREAFPDELGGEHTADEMDGKTYDTDPRVSAEQKTRTLDEQIGTASATAEDPEPKKASSGKQVTKPQTQTTAFEEVVEALSKARTDDDADAALDLARELPEEERKKLTSMANTRKTQLGEKHDQEI